MKKNFLFAFVVTIAFTGCKKDSESPSNVAECTINAAKFSFTMIEFIDVTYESSTTYSISNYGDEDRNSLEMELEDPIVGDNNFSSSNYIRLEIGEKVYHSKSSSGKITLTKKEEKLLEGTFSGTFQDNDLTDVQITGSFSAVQISNK